MEKISISKPKSDFRLLTGCWSLFHVKHEPLTAADFAFGVEKSETAGGETKTLKTAFRRRRCNQDKATMSVSGFITSSYLSDTHRCEGEERGRKRRNINTREVNIVMAKITQTNGRKVSLKINSSSRGGSRDSALFMSRLRPLLHSRSARCCKTGSPGMFAFVDCH